MFWESVWKGLMVLGHWETYVLIGLCLLASFLVMLVENKLAERKGKPLGMFGMLVGNAIKMSALMVCFLTLAPIIFHRGDGAAWSAPWVLLRTHPFIVYNLLGLLLISASLLDLIPWLNRLPTLFFSLIGCETLAFIAWLFNKTAPQLQSQHIPLFPGAWFTLGLLVVGVVIARIAIPFAMVFGIVIEHRLKGAGRALASTALGALGFLPAFMYGAWLGERLTQALGV
jgi:hypothetical protein